MTVEQLRKVVNGAKRAKAETSLDPLAALARFAVTDAQVKEMKETRLIGSGLAAWQHVGAWCAPANGGKTTIARSFAAEVASEFIVLFFQEDASAGDIPALHEHAKRHGYQLLNSTLSGATPEDQIKVLRGFVKEKARLERFVFIIDTLKKYSDLMSKGSAKAFLNLMRQLTQLGATVILLGHTNKHKGADGKLIFEGVGDVRNDVDELIYIEATPKDAVGIVTLTMKPDKVRCAIRESTFQLDTRTMDLRRLDHVVDVAALNEAARQRQEDDEVIAVVLRILRPGGMPHTALLDRVVKETGKSRTASQRVVDRYLSDDPTDQDALWIETKLRANNTRHVGLKPGAER